MKLFQRLLVAPAALGLLAPIAANATEVNLNDISSYSEGEIEIDSNSFNQDLKQTPLLISGGEGLVTEPSSGSFSTTTAASFSVDMSIGAQDNTPIGGAVSAAERTEAAYSFQMDLTTSFTGEDSLDISIDAGNAGGATAEFDGNTGGDGLVVDGVA